AVAFVSMFSQERNITAAKRRSIDFFIAQE
ncbi:MAG: hypothetical protein ACI9HJ_001761, partial [Ulvibacter sp.]